MEIEIFEKLKLAKKCSKLRKLSKVRNVCKGRPNNEACLLKFAFF